MITNKKIVGYSLLLIVYGLIISGSFITIANCANGDFAYVTDNTNHKLYRYAFNELSNFTGGVLTVDTGLYYPLGIAVNEDYVFVANAGNDTVEVYDLNLNHVGYIGTYAEENDTTGFNIPRSVEVDSQFLYIADFNNYRIVVRELNTPFAYVGEYNLTGYGKPDDVVVTDDYVFVVCYWEGMFCIIDKDSGSVIANYTHSEADYNTKMDIYNGKVYVTLDNPYEISIYDASTYAFLDNWSESYQGLGIDIYNDYYYLCDSTGGKIRLYNIDESYYGFIDQTGKEPYDIVIVVQGEFDYGFVIWVFWFVIAFTVISFALYIKYGGRR